MALSKTTLAAACGATDLTIAVTSATGFPAVGVVARSQRVQIDGEFCYTIDGIAQPATGTIKLRSRGADGSAATAHAILSQVATSATGTDWSNNPQGGDCSLPPYRALQITVGENGVIPVPIQDTVIFLNKATALASTTLAAPSADSNGVTIVITSTTAAAHVITATGLLADGASGSPEDTATFAAFIGASMTLVVANGLYNVTALNGVTIS